MAIQLSEQYPQTYYDPNIHNQWQEKFGLEFTLFMDVVCLHTLTRSNGHTPHLVLFDGEPRQLPDGSKFQISPQLRVPSKKASIIDRILRRKPKSGYVMSIISVRNA